MAGVEKIADKWWILHNPYPPKGGFLGIAVWKSAGRGQNPRGKPGEGAFPLLAPQVPEVVPEVGPLSVLAPKGGKFDRLLRVSEALAGPCSLGVGAPLHFSEGIGKLHLVVHAELLVNPENVSLHRGGGDEEGVPNLFIPLAEGQELGDLELPIGERSLGGHPLFFRRRDSRLRGHRDTELPRSPQGDQDRQKAGEREDDTVQTERFRERQGEAGGQLPPPAKNGRDRSEQDGATQPQVLGPTRPSYEGSHKDEDQGRGFYKNHGGKENLPPPGKNGGQTQKGKQTNEAADQFEGSLNHRARIEGRHNSHDKKKVEGREKGVQSEEGCGDDFHVKRKVVAEPEVDENPRPSNEEEGEEHSDLRAWVPPVPQKKEHQGQEAEA